MLPFAATSIGRPDAAEIATRPLREDVTRKSRSRAAARGRDRGLAPERLARGVEARREEVLLGATVPFSRGADAGDDHRSVGVGEEGERRAGGALEVELDAGLPAKRAADVEQEEARGAEVRRRDEPAFGRPVRRGDRVAGVDLAEHPVRLDLTVEAPPPKRDRLRRRIEPSEVHLAVRPARERELGRARERPGERPVLAPRHRRRFPALRKIDRKQQMLRSVRQEHRRPRFGEPKLLDVELRPVAKVRPHIGEVRSKDRLVLRPNRPKARRLTLG